MYRIERQHEGPTRGHWLPVKGATYGTREEAAETMAAELRRAAAEGRSKTERFRIALAAVTDIQRTALARWRSSVRAAANGARPSR